MINVEQTIISQYANSPTITQLIKNINSYIDPRSDIENFFNFVWNVDTAQGFGLDIWGRIVGVDRYLLLPVNEKYFGFSDAAPEVYPFNEGIFYNGQSNSTDTHALSDTAFRKLIYAKAISNIININAPSINQLISNLFVNRGKCYVLDLGEMKMQYVFEFALTNEERAIISQSTAIPRPAGVSMTFSEVI